LVVVPHVADAAELAQGLEVLGAGVGVGVVPSEGAALFGGAEPPLAARLELTRLLRDLATGQTSTVIAPARALLACIPSPRDMLERSLELKQGQQLDPVDFAARLTSLGYRRVDLVEEAGELALRGWVVDVHPGGEHALRIELDDERVERMKPFDPATQRSCGEALEIVQLLPLDPFEASDSARELLAELVEARFPGLAAMVRDRVERRLWWSYLAEVSESMSWLELCDELIVCDRDEVAGELARWHAVQIREWQTLSERHTPLPAPHEVMGEPDGIGEKLAAAPLRIEQLELQDNVTSWWRVRTHPVEEYARRIPDLLPMLHQRRAQELVQLLIVASPGEQRRFTHLLAEDEVTTVSAPPGPGQVAIVQAQLRRGFVWEDRLAVYGRRNLTAAPPPRRRSGFGAFVSDLRDLKPGDFIVHLDHGIGRFAGYKNVEVEGKTFEMLSLTYARGDTLLVPVERADLIQKYSTGDAVTAPRLDRLGSGSWRRRTARVRKAVQDMAAELMRMAAMRHSVQGHQFSPDSPWQREFEQAFEYELTSDQHRAVGEVKQDMESPKPMDRLICGDVGYGKTEVAVRAAFKAVLEGKQVAILAPTTILVEQHLQTLRRRLQSFPVEIAMLSRFVPAKVRKQVLTGLSDGRVDIVVGTHRLLASDVRFRDLGLLIVDEEQRFGVKQKERLKHVRAEVDMIALSATPIPRTLNMALSGLRDVSLIETPPRDRQAVETSVLEFSADIVREAVLYEMERGGQVFFVHNRVRSIGAFAQWLQRVVPEARIVVGHGQMAEAALEKAMRRFLDGEADVLLATAIIENGLDIPNANTLLVNRADRFGLAQLYQLRGRVGRSDRLAFAYFLVPPERALSTTARARLAAVQEFCELGAGFRIAARDLEIRGAGNLLGAEQHGFMEAVGFETYCQLLEEAVAELQGQPLTTHREVELRLGLDLQLPEAYIPEPALRLSFYKRLAVCPDEEAIRTLLEEVVDRYGPRPRQLDNLVTAQRLRIAARRAAVSSVQRRGSAWRLRFDAGLGAPAPLVPTLAHLPGARVTPTGELLVPIISNNQAHDELLAFVEALGDPGVVEENVAAADDEAPRWGLS